jgi:hypothetical protein
LYDELLFYYPWKFILLTLLRSDFEEARCGFVDEKCVDEVDENFVCIIQELKDCRFLDVLKAVRFSSRSMHHEDVDS